MGDEVIAAIIRDTKLGRNDFKGSGSARAGIIHSTTLIGVINQRQIYNVVQPLSEPGNSPSTTGDVVIDEKVWGCSLIGSNEHPIIFLPRQPLHCRFQVPLPGRGVNPGGVQAAHPGT